MARSRNIKPGLYQNDVLAECSVWARYIFPGLWMLADREGRLEDRPARIKATLLPYDNQNTDRLLTELHNHGFICRYTAGGSKYIQILNFTKHQNPHSKEPASSIPDPPPECMCLVKALDEHGAPIVQELDGHGSGPADSGFPLTDPLNRIPDTPKPGSDPGPLPFQSARFVEAWGNWNQHRREIGKPLKPTSVRRQFAKLAAMGEDRAVRALDYSTANGYQGIFEPSGSHGVRSPPPDRAAKLLKQAHEAANRDEPHE